MSTAMQSIPMAQAAQSLADLAADRRMQRFKVNVSRQAVEELHRRISGRQWSNREAVEDSSLSCFQKRAGVRFARFVHRAQ